MPMLPTSYHANPEKMSNAPIDEACRPMTSSGVKAPSRIRVGNYAPLKHPWSVCLRR